MAIADRSTVWYRYYLLDANPHRTAITTGLWTGADPIFSSPDLAVDITRHRAATVIMAMRNLVRHECNDPFPRYKLERSRLDRDAEPTTTYIHHMAGCSTVQANHRM